MCVSILPMRKNMSIDIKQYLVEFDDGQQDYLGAEDLQEVFEWIKAYASEDKVIAIYKQVWEPENEET